MFIQSRFILSFVVAILAAPAAFSAEAPVHPWTPDEAQNALEINPHDPFLQFAALQLAHREKNTVRAQSIEQTIGGIARNEQREERTADAFSLFSGAAAVQESLQLDTLHDAGNPQKWDNAAIDLATLKGPEVQSHPWQLMLAQKNPFGVHLPQELSGLSRCIPVDYYFIEFQSLAKLLELQDLKDLWGAHLLSQASGVARKVDLGARVRKQLAIEVNPLMRPFYDMVVESVAVTGSDLYVNEGSDVTLLFAMRQPEVFRARMDGFLDNAKKAHPDAEVKTGTFMDVAYTVIATPGRELSVISAYPMPNIHVRSNSLPAFCRVIETIKGANDKGEHAANLAESFEFKYIRTIFEQGAKEEDGFVYLSDPFIRRIVGPRVKLTEYRRMACYNHLRMIEYAALLYQTEKGNAPANIDELVKAEFLPDWFKNEKLLCLDGGTCTLGADGTGVCNFHGHTNFLRPCCELPLARITEYESGAYKAFLREYNRYWRQYFDPIAMRVQVTPQQARLETIILPLIDNSTYTSLAQVTGGEPTALDAQPTPRTIFSMNMHVNRKALDLRAFDFPPLTDNFLMPAGLTGEFLEKGIGEQIGLHFYDSVPTLDVNLARIVGDLLSQRIGGMGSEEMLGGAFIAGSLNSPVYISIPVRDRAIVDKFLDNLDSVLAGQARKTQPNGWWWVQPDSYTIRSAGGATIHACAFGFSGFKWRVFWGRVGDGLYMASKPFIFDDIAALAAGKAAEKTPEAPAHALIRVRPEHWKETLPDFRIGWAENSRCGCLNNISMLRNVVRAQHSVPAATPAGQTQSIEDGVARLYGEIPFCPEGGVYINAPDGEDVVCSVHGSPLHPRQPSGPLDKGASAQFLNTFAGMSAALTFTGDGLRAVVTIKRK